MCVCMWWCGVCVCVVCVYVHLCLKYAAVNYYNLYTIIQDAINIYASIEILLIEIIFQAVVCFSDT